MRERYRRLSAWVRNLKPVRVYRTYSTNGGNLSAAGMSFQSLFAVFAGIYVGFAIAGLVVRNSPELVQSIIDFINTQIPGLIGPNGVIHESDLLRVSTLGWTGGLAILILAWTAVTWLDYTRIAFHRVFNVPRAEVSALSLKILDFVVAIVFGLFIVASAVLSAVGTGFSSWLVDLLGWSRDNSWVSLGTQAMTLGFVWIVDTLILALFIRTLTGIPIPGKKLLQGTMLGALALGILKVLGTAILGGATRNPLLASFAVILALLIWFNFISRIYLLTAAWIAVSMRDAGLEPEDAGWQQAKEVLGKVRRKKPQKEAST